MDRFAVECRAGVRGDTLHGHAAVFGQHARLPGHWETLGPAAFNEALKESDAAALVNHDVNQLLGRQSAGTLRLGVDRFGLAFEVDLPDTQPARDLRANIGNYGGMSFGFIPGADEWSEAPDGRQLRTHTSVRELVDVSVVVFPAYAGTSVALRHVDFDRPADRIRRTQQLTARLRALQALQGGR